MAGSLSGAELRPMLWWRIRCRMCFRAAMPSWKKALEILNDK